MNILLVEDEPPILREIEHYITKFGEPFHVFATAADGQYAKELIDTYHNEIDYLLTDIQIPMINGLELIKYVEENYPEILCSILTGFDDFSYAQRAIRLRVLDYILKPVDEAVLLEQLKQAYEHKCLQSVSSDRICQPVASIESAEAFAHYRQILITIGQFSYKTDVFLENDTILPDFTSLEQTLKEFHTYYKKYWLIRNKNRHTVYLLFSFQQSQLNSCQLFYQQFYSSLLTNYEMVSVVLESSPITIHNINSKIQTLDKFISENILFARSGLFHLTDASLPSYAAQQQTDKELADKITRFSKLFSNYSREMFYTELKQYILYLKHHSITQKKLSYFLTTLLTECIFPFLHLDSIQNMNPYDIIHDTIMLSSSFESLYENLVFIFDDIFVTIMNEKKTFMGKSSVFIQIDDYIKRNYTNPLNTRDIADQFGFTPAYLSKLFREYKKLTPAEYISSLRISKAKELLESNPSLTIREVAFATGYEDPLYFSKVFKKIVGKTPKSFQSK